MLLIISTEYDDICEIKVMGVETFMFQIYKKLVFNFPGVFVHQITLPSRAVVELRTFALRDVPSIFVRDLRVYYAQPGEKIIINIRNFTNFATPDFKLNISRSGTFV